MRQKEGELLNIFRRMRNNSVSSKDAEYMNENTLISEKHPCPNILKPPYVPIIVFSHYERYKIQQMILKEINKSNIPVYCFKAKLFF